MKEIEVLLEVKSKKEDVLHALGRFDSRGVKKTLDIYFFDPLRNDLCPEKNGRLRQSFRLRDKGGKYSLTYKIDHFSRDDVWIYSDEHEVPVKNFNTTLLIIQYLGLKELVRIESEKRVFITTDYEIVLEDVKDLGLFLEVERLSDVLDNEVEFAKGEIRNFIAKLGVKIGEELNCGKPELMLKRSV